MEAIGTLILGLVLVNGLLLIVIGMVLTANPLKVEILAAVAAANALVFFFAALLTTENPAGALLTVGSKLLPFLVIAAGFVALVVVQTKLRSS